jgi:hypothetical protein
VVDSNWLTGRVYICPCSWLSNHLVERLNGALRSRQDYDFTDLYQALQLLFVEFAFEMYVKLW